MIKWERISPALASRNFRLFWVAQLVSTTGTFLQYLAERWLIYELTGSTLMLGLISFAGLLPVVPVSILGGYLIDRVPRRKLIVVTQTGLFGQAVVFGLLIVTGQIQVWHIILLDFMLGLFAAIDQPARQTFLVELVGKEKLPNAVALNAMLFHFARMTGFTLSGLLIGTIGAAGTVFINALTYLATIGAMLLINVPDVRHVVAQKRLGAALSDGAKTLLRAPALLGVLSLLAIVGGLAWPVYGMMPAFVETELPTGATGLGLLLGAGGLGALLGTAVIAQIKVGRRGWALTLASFITPLFVMGFALSRTMLVAVLFSMALGLALLILQTMANTLIQINIPDQVRGRVMSIYTLINSGAPAAAGVATGMAAEFYGLSTILIWVSGVALLYALIAFVAVSAIRRLE